MKIYDEALIFIAKAFEIAEKSLPKNHPDRENYKKDLGRINNKISLFISSLK